MSTHVAQAPSKSKKKPKTKQPNCLFDGFLFPLRTNHYRKPLSLLETHYISTITK